MRVLVTKTFKRFQRKERISDQALLQAIERAEVGLVDADLGDGLIKQRVARPGQVEAAAFELLSRFVQADALCSCLASPKARSPILMPPRCRIGKRSALT